jgi:phosphoribosylanthranilate isomerase
MKIKVCGMRYPENIKGLVKLSIDFMGLIFYEKSPRFVEGIDLSGLSALPKRVGVFVDAEMDYITEVANKYGLSLIQLHGNESPDFCKRLPGLKIIKAFSIPEYSDFEQTKPYEGIADYFLFDTKTPQHGGSGQKFDWNILNEYKGDTPFFLSGGISLEDAERIKQIQQPKLYGIDLNSRFETKPGLKDIELLKQFINTLKDEQD